MGIQGPQFRIEKAGGLFEIEPHDYRAYRVSSFQGCTVVEDQNKLYKVARLVTV